MSNANQAIRILHLEDSGSDAEMVKDRLDADGLRCDVVWVDSRDRFDAALSGTVFDLILCDFNLPGYDGSAALELAKERHPATPVMVVSGSLNPEEAVRCLKQGATDYILKDRLERLPAAVRRALEEAGEHRRREQAEEHFRTLFDQAPDGILVVDASGHFTDINAAGRLLTGYSREELLRLNIPDLVAHEEVPRVARELARLKTGDGVISEWTICRRDGSTFLGEVHARQLPDGRLQAFLRDITEIKNVEKERGRTERMIREQAQLLDQARDGIVVRDMQNRTTYWNNGAQNLYGWTAAEAIGKTPDELMFNGESDELTEAERALKENGEWVGTLSPATKAGKKVIVESRWSLLRDENGQPKGKLIISTDVTERKQLQEQMVQAQRMETIGTLSAGIAHDFNNLLTVILGYSNLILRVLPKEDRLTAKIACIQNAGERAAGLTRQLLAFSRKQILQPRIVDLNELIGNLGKMLPRLIGENIEIVTALNPELGKIKADPGQIDQVIMNLVVNARDAMPNGGKLTVETANITLTPEHERTHLGGVGPHVVVSVSDTGTGMDKATKDLIFEPFFTTKPKESGTGLGLSTVYGIVKQSGGSIWVYSEPGLGTTFKIYFPQVENSGEPFKNTAAPHIVRGGPETILLIEDDAGVRQLARHILEEKTYTVLEARSEGEALLLTEKHHKEIGLVLTDVILPGRGGRELADEILLRIPGVRVLYMSGYPANAIARQGVLDEGINFIEKPFTPERLAMRVREVLDL